MNGPSDSIDAFADLVVPHDPSAFRERLLAVVVARLGARRVALFLADGGRLRLAASSGVDQAALDRAQRLWSERAGQLVTGRAFLERSRDAGSAFVVLPVAEPEGLLYAELGGAPTAQALRDLEGLARLCAIAMRGHPSAAHASRGPAAEYLRHSTENDLLRDKLVLALQEHEWNIARVARLLGVSRRTIYLRLQRWDIPRQRVFKTRRREA